MFLVKKLIRHSRSTAEDKTRRMAYKSAKKVFVTDELLDFEGSFRDVKMRELNGRAIIVSRDKDSIFGYEFDYENRVWKKVWRKKILEESSDFSLLDYQWHDVDDIVIVKNPERGIQFYEITRSELKLLAEDRRFHIGRDSNVLTEQTFLVGKFFPHPDILAIAMKDKHGRFAFYGLSRNKVSQGISQAFVEIRVKPTLSEDWNDDDAQIYIEQLTKNSDNQQTLIVFNKRGLTFFKFNHKYELEQKFKTTLIRNESANDRLYFANLSAQQYKDVLVLNDFGLNTYTFDSTANDYTLTNQNLKFARDFSRGVSIKMFDANSDGIDDLAFHDTKAFGALTYNPSTNMWNSIIASECFSPGQQHYKIVSFGQKASGNDKETVVFFGDNSRHLHAAELKSLVKSENCRDVYLTPDKSDMELSRRSFDELMPAVAKYKNAVKFTKKWSESIDHSFINNVLNEFNGKISFTMPLFHVTLSPLLRINGELQYQSSVLATTSGTGFSLSTTDDFISVNYQGSLLPDDALFCVNSAGVREPLQLIKIEEHFSQFQLVDPDKKSVDVKYYSRLGFWVVDTPLEKVIYGSHQNRRDIGVVQMGLSWKNWRGKGTDSSALIQVPLSWYIAERYSKGSDQSVFFKYRSTISGFESNEYTSDLRLIEIHDGKKTRILFGYGNKGSAELENLNFRDANGALLLDNLLVNKYFVTSVKVSTEQYVQHFEFSYDVKKNKRLLVNVGQKLFEGKENLISIEYHQHAEQFYIKSLETANGMKTKFVHNNQNFPRRSLEKVVPMRSRPVVARGSNFVAFASASGEKIFIEILESTTMEVIKTQTISAPKLEIFSLSIRALQNFFMLTFRTKNNSHIQIFQSIKGKWDIARYEFSKTAIILVSSDIIAIGDKSTLTILEQQTGPEKSWKTSELKQSSNIERMAIHNQHIAAVSSDRLFLVHRNQNGWTDSSLVFATSVVFNKFEDSVASVNRFDVTNEIKEMILSSLSQDGLQIYGNTIMMTSLKENSGILSTVVSLYTLSENLSMNLHQKFEVPRDDVFSVTKTFPFEKTLMEMHYFEEGGKFKVRSKSASGQIDDDLHKQYTNKNLFADAKKKFIKKQNEDSEMLKAYKEMFLLKLDERYRPLLNSNEIYFGDDVVIRHTGYEWKKVSTSERHYNQLGQHLIVELDKANPKVVKIFKQNRDGEAFGEARKVMELHSPSAISYNFPFYIVYQNTAAQVVLEVFDKDGKGFEPSGSFDDETLLSSDAQHLMTLRKSSPSSKKIPHEVVIRTIADYIQERDEIAVKKVTRTSKGETRLKNFDRTFNTEGGTFSQTVTTIPEESTFVSGWIEDTLTILDGTRFQHLVEQFDSGGKKVKSEIKEQRNDNEVEAQQNEDFEKYSDNLLLDQSGVFRICNFLPFKKSEGTVGYFGFENYEKADGMTFNKDMIVKSENSFTGKAFLRLKSGEAFKKAFEPADQRGTFIASTWLRSGALFGQKTSADFKATISSDGVELLGIIGEVKKQVGEWHLLQLVLDFDVLRNIQDEFILNEAIKSNKLQTYTNSKLKIDFVISSTTNEVLDVDNFSFYPITLDFEASVYDETSGQVKAVIKGDGSVARFFFNTFNSRIFAKTDKNERVEQMILASRSTDSGHSKVETIFTPENGFHERFDGVLFNKHWEKLKIMNKQWTVSLGQIHHTGSEDALRSKSGIIDNESAVIRFTYGLQTIGAQLKIQWMGLKINLKSDSNKVELTVSKVSKEFGKFSTNHHAEIAIMMHHQRVFIWLSGNLVLDQSTPLETELFSMKVIGDVIIEDLFVLNKPKVDVRFYNAWDELTQKIHLESHETVSVSHKLYDNLGRMVIKTKHTRMRSQGSDPLLKSYNKFVEKMNWKTGELKGQVSELNQADHGFPYTRTVYRNDPLEEKVAVGLPGKDYSVNGLYKKTYSDASKISFLSVHFPSNLGFTQQVETLPNGTRRVLVFDKTGNKVAKYVQTNGFEDHMSTFEFSSENLIVKVLPPLYHKKVGTFTSTKVYSSGEDQLTHEEKDWQQKLGTHFKHDDSGNVVETKSPDAGTKTFIYNSKNQLKFTIDAAGHTVYFNYDSSGLITETGHFDKRKSLEYLRKFVESDDIVNSKKFQSSQFDQVGSKKILETSNHNSVTVEGLTFNANSRITSKTIMLNAVNVFSLSADIRKKYKGNQVHSIHYPSTEIGKRLELLHDYNEMGQLIGLGIPDEPSRFVSFSYHADSQIASETHHQNDFVREFEYNSPGFIEKISDRFLSEEISYTDGGYGQKGFGGGIVMSTMYKPKWSQHPFNDVLSSNYEKKIPSNCFAHLKKLGFITKDEKLAKIFDPHSANDLPLKCVEDAALEELLAKQFVPSSYGHRFSYGAHRELVKAKYFSDDLDVSPLQPDTFMKELEEVSLSKSQEIWKILTGSEFVSVDQRDGSSFFGLLGVKSLIREHDLLKQLGNLSSVLQDFKIYYNAIKKLTTKLVSQGAVITLPEFEKIFFDWNDISEAKDFLEVHKLSAKTIFDSLSSNGLLPTSASNKLSALNPDLNKALEKNTKLIPGIIKTLSKHFHYGLGASPFDFGSNKIDVNGNHQNFVTGFRSLKCDYEPGNNKINNIEITQLNELKTKKFALKHDANGNVIIAPHKGIINISYHPVSQRVTSMYLEDGRTLKFHYDAQGERTLKQVFDKDNTITSETFYVRDETGRVLMERLTTFLSVPRVHKETTTHFIYGPSNLVGFIRNDIFHSVFTDHSGSIRLVIRNGEVVAAYDYLPYGGTMREFLNDPDAGIFYRYNGMEFDQETNTYNFHSRFYDPAIGRFLQPDPQSQYFSAYKFAGNSPMSFVDPDGELAFLIPLAFAAVGGYVFGAAANNRWNPADWDNDSSTYIGIAAGMITGAFTAIGFPASVGAVGYAGTISLGLGGAYLYAAGVSKSFDPTDWKWTRPDLYAAMITGVYTGVSFPGGIDDILKFSAKRTFAGSYSKPIFLFISVGSGLVFAYGNAASETGEAKFWKWEWSDPSTYVNIVNGFFIGHLMPMNFMKMDKGIRKLWRGGYKNVGFSEVATLKGELKFKIHPNYKAAAGIVLAYVLMSEANKGFDPSNWNPGSFLTYQAALNGMFGGKDLLKIANPKLFKKSDAPKSAPEVQPPIERIQSVERVAEVAIKKLNVEMENLKGNVINQALPEELQIPKEKSAGFKNLPEADIHYQKKLGEKLSKSVNELENIQQSQEARNEINIDREVDFLGPCRSKRSSCASGSIPDEPHAQSVMSNVAQYNLKLNRAFSLSPINILGTNMVVDGIKKTYSNGAVGDVALFKKPNKQLLLKVPSSSSSGTFPVILATGGDEVRIPLNGTVNHNGKIVQIHHIVMPGLADDSIYSRVEDGYLTLYRTGRTKEIKVYVNDPNLNNDDTLLKMKDNPIFWTENGEPIVELKSVKRLFTVQGIPVEVELGSISISDSGLFHKSETGDLVQLKSINGATMNEIISKNKKIKTETEKLVSKYDAAIHVEDRFPSYRDETWVVTKVLEKLEPTHSSAFVYLDTNENVWKFASQSVKNELSSSPAIEVFVKDLTPMKQPQPTTEKQQIHSEHFTRRKRANNRINDTLNLREVTGPSKSLYGAFVGGQSERNFNDRNSHGPSITEMGDQWLNQTNNNETLMLLYSFIKRWSGREGSSHSNSHCKGLAMTPTESNIQASIFLNTFKQMLVDSSVKCGFPTVIRKLLFETDLEKITKEISKKFGNNSVESIPSYLTLKIVKSNKEKIIARSSLRQYLKFCEILSDFEKTFALQLLKEEEERCNRFLKSSRNYEMYQ